MATINSNTINLSLNSTYSCLWGDEDHNTVINGSAPTTNTQSANFTNPVPAGGTITAMRLVTTWSYTGGVNKAQVDGSALAAGTDTRGVSGFNHSYTWKCTQVCGAYQSQGNYTRTMTVSAYMSVDYTPPTAASLWGVTLDSSGATQYRGAGAGLTLAWSAANGTNNNISSYSVWYNDDGAGWVALATGVGSTSYTVYNHPTAGHQRQWLVQAIAPYGNSGQVASPVAVAYSPVTAPTWCSISPASRYPGEQTTLSWGGAGNGTGTSVTGYYIYLNDVWQTTVTGTSYTFASPGAGSYTYTVRAAANIYEYFSVPSPGAVLTVANPASTGTLNKSTVPMDDVSTIQMTIVPANAAYTHNVMWYIDGHSSTSIWEDKAAGDNTSTLTVPKSWCNHFPNAPSGTGWVMLSTYNGATLIKQVWYSYSVTVPADILPTVSLAVAPVDGFNGLYLQGKSKATLTATDAGAYGSTITARSFYGSGYSGSSNPYTTGILNTPGNNTMTVVVTDSRGRQATATQVIAVPDYYAPAISLPSAFRANDAGVAAPHGEYIAVFAGLTVAPIAGNSGTATVKKRITGGTWDTAVSITHNTTIVLSGVTLENAYEVLITLTDTVGTVSTYTTTVRKATFMYDLRNDRAALGQLAGDTKTFTVPDDWTTNVNADKLDGNHASAFAAASHPHGNITSDGKVGTVADKTLMTGTDGLVVAKTMAEAIAIWKFTNPNLLHNWDFRNPVNQRKVSGTISAEGYFYDRWIKAASGTVVKYDNPNYIVLTANTFIYQRVEGFLLCGKPVTISAIDIDGTTVYSATGVVPSEPTIQTNVQIGGGFYGAFAIDTAGVYFGFGTGSVGVGLLCIKLEMGTVSTLAYDPPMDYGAELLKCQRFYNRFVSQHNYYLFSHGIQFGGDNALHIFHLPCAMRITPSIFTEGLYYGTYTVDGMTNNTVVVKDTTTRTPETNTYMYDGGSNNSSISFSADL